MAILKLNSHEVLTQSGDNRPEFGAGVPSGTVLQVQYTQYTGTASMTNVATAVNYVLCDGTAGSGTEILNVNITPKFNNSKLWIQVSWCGEFSAANAVYNSMFFLFRNNTKLGQANAGTLNITGIMPPALSYEGTDGSSTLESCYFQYFDEPQTMSQVTYKLGIIVDVALTLTTNRTITDNTTSAGYERGISSISVMEIAA